MKKSLVVLFVIATIAITGIAYAAEILATITYEMAGVAADPYQWTPISYRNLEPLTSGVAARKITVNWQSGHGLVEKVRLYKDDVYVEKSVPPYGKSMEFTESEVLGMSCAHYWGVQFKVSYTPYYYVWVNSSISFYGLPVAENSNPPAEH